MKKAGCRLIIPGIESGTQEILDNIQKGTKLEQIYKYVENAKKAGLLIHACYMVGNQGETKETMQKTLNLALQLNTDTAQFFPLIPYPGTKAYNWAKELNDKQDHDPQKDAEMLKFVNIFVEQKSALPNCPYGAKTIKSSNGLGVCEANYAMPHGAFWCKGTGKNSKKHNFNSCDEAIDWLITTQYAAQDKPIARRDRIATNIMMAIRKKNSYKGFRWGRLKEDII